MKPEFDIDRLAKEIDERFQEKNTKYVDELDKNAEEVYKDFVRETAKASKSAQIELGDTIKKLVGMHRDTLIEEIKNGRAVIHIGESLKVNVGHMDHPETENVVKSLGMFRKAMLVGPAGTGKTTLISNLAESMKLDFYKYSCSRDSSVHDLLGYKQPKSETYLETSFLRAYEYGGIFLVDEYDAMSGDMALFFNGIADNSKFISVPHRDDKPTAVKHKNFYLVMCGNTWGKGSYEYTGRDLQDKALMDRFRLCRHHIGYHIDLEKSLLGTHYAFAQNLRKEFEAMGSYLSTRNFEDVSILLNSGVKREKIIDILIEDLSESDKIQFRQKKQRLCQ